MSVKPDNPSNSSKVVVSCDLTWIYDKPPKSGKCLLLTSGGIAVIGEWTGDVGQYYIAHHPLPKRSKQTEKDRGLNWYDDITEQA